MATKAVTLFEGAAPAKPRTDAAPEGALRPSDVLNRARANVEHLAKGGEILVFGEVSGPKVTPTGHITFDLKDARAKLPCIVFYNDTRRLKFELKHGMQIVAAGKPTVTDWAQVQMRVARVDPVGEGALDLAFRQLKEKLEGEGLFLPEKKRALPKLPRTVGVVTSSSGAALRDVLKVLYARMPGLHVVVSPTKVQGDGAAADVAEALRRLDRARLCEVILVVRGGGSLEDLWAFNTEPVARAIAGCSVPVISGVGHENDVTIADLAADKRAATPSNAAELCVPHRDELAARVDAERRHLAAALARLVERARVRLNRVHKRLADPRALVAKRRAAVGALEQRLERALARRRERARAQVVRADEKLRALSPAKQIAARRAKLAALSARLSPAVNARRARFGRLLAVFGARLDGVSPLTVLSRGYAIARRRDDGRVVRAPADAPPGTALDVVVDKGAVVKVTVDDE